MFFKPQFIYDNKQFLAFINQFRLLLSGAKNTCSAHSMRRECPQCNDFLLNLLFRTYHYAFVIDCIQLPNRCKVCLIPPYVQNTYQVDAFVPSSPVLFFPSINAIKFLRQALIGSAQILVEMTITDWIYISNIRIMLPLTHGTEFNSVQQVEILISLIYF